MSTFSAVATTTYPAQVEVPALRCRRSLTIATLVAADVFSILFAGSVAVSLRLVMHGQFHLSDYATLLTALPLFLLVFSALNLYPGIATNTIEEFRKLMQAITLSWSLIVVSNFFIKVGDHYSRVAFGLAWALSLLLVPICRRSVRSFGSKQSWWGVPTVIFGTDNTDEAMLHLLNEQATLGLRPIALLHNDREAMRRNGTGGLKVQDGLFRGSFSDAALLAKRNPGAYAIFALPTFRGAELEDMLNEHALNFHHTMVIPDVSGMSSLWVSARDIGGVLGLEVEQRLTHLHPRIIKRCFDLLVSSLILLMLLPLFAVLYLAVRFTSKGPVFYGQKRIGRGHCTFTAWKFRSMVMNADEVLEEHLERDPALRAEWELDRKLRRDPRITGIGRLMRKTSLDELPQLWNVLSGQMSLVGPRPIVHAEVDRYGRRYQHYRRVQPGITGMWQISGRNNTTYDRRTQLDEYYVRNWSVSLDLYILYRTVRTVLFTEGAY